MKESALEGAGNKKFHLLKTPSGNIYRVLEIKIVS